MFLVTFEQIRTVTVAKRGKLDASSIRGDAYYATFFILTLFYFFGQVRPGFCHLPNILKGLK